MYVHTKADNYIYIYIDLEHELIAYHPGLLVKCDRCFIMLHKVTASACLHDFSKAEIRKWVGVAH